MDDPFGIIDYLEWIGVPERRLMPANPKKYARAQRLIGIASAGCEKTVQLVYERDRPIDKQHQPWIDRVQRQMLEAFRLLEADLDCDGRWLVGDKLTQPDISVAVAWRFNQFVLSRVVPAERHPKLVEFSRRAEALPEFLSLPLD